MKNSEKMEVEEKKRIYCGSDPIFLPSKEKQRAAPKGQVSGCRLRV